MMINNSSVTQSSSEEESNVHRIYTWRYIIYDNKRKKFLAQEGSALLSAFRFYFLSYMMITHSLLAE
jgi:hypothetical protein